MAESMKASGRSARKGAIAVVLIALAVLFAVLYRIDNSREDHSYNSGATPPTTVRITLGKQYEISTPGGPKTVTARIGSTASLNCNYTPANGSSTSQLDTTRLDSGTRTTHAVATFIGPVSGSVRIECRALPATFIDDADNVSADPAGAFLLLCTISLAVGVLLGISALYWRGQGRPGEAGSLDRDGDAGPGDGESDPRPLGAPGENDDYGHLLASPTDG